VRALNGCVEVYLALGDVARAAEIVVELRTGRVIHAGGKVYIVVTGAAGRARWLGEIVRGIYRAAFLAVASFGAPHIRRIHDRRPVAPVERVGRPRYDAGKPAPS